MHLWRESNQRGGGKTFAEILDPIFDIENPKFTAQMFRKNENDIMKNGGLFETARDVYPHVGGEEKFTRKMFVFPSGATINFSHLDNETESVIDDRFRGLQMPAIYVDECTQIKFSTIMKLITSNRNGHGIRNRMHLSCNPDASSWLRKFIDWFIDEDGHIIKERDGVIRYFFLAGKTVDDVIWGDTREEVYEKAKAQIDKAWNPKFEEEFGMTPLSLIKDMTFIEGDLFENKMLMESDPTYLANIAQGSDEDRARNIEGNWNVSSDDSTQMVSRERLDNAFNIAEQRTGTYRMSVDVALQGSDNCVIVIWDGLHVVDIDARGYIESVGDLKAIMDHYIDLYNIREENVYYDAVGIGAVLTDYKQAYPVKPRSKPVNKDESFAFFKDQIMWHFGNLILNDKISFSTAVIQKKFDCGKRGSLTLETILQHEIKALKIDLTSGKTKMLNKPAMKAILGHSPDFLEALVYGIIHTLIKRVGSGGFSKLKGL